MKKKVVPISLALLIFGISHAKIDKAFLETVDFLRVERGFIVPAKVKAKKYAKGYGISGGVLGILYGIGYFDGIISYRFPFKNRGVNSIAFCGAIGTTVGTAVGGAVGFFLGAVGAIPQRSFLRSRLNSTLRKYVSKDFEDLGQSQAALIYASYMRDTKKMNDVLNLPGNGDFLKMAGVREAVSKFYYGNASPESLEKLEALVGL